MSALIIGVCALTSYIVWQAIGTTLQQIILGTLAVGFVWNCVVPVFTVIAILTVIFGISYLLDRW
ncbi:MAG: hypothetical protein ACD_61C00046G0001 [uncultured bacterium]|nr:MAG: hypothetical protein ACD_61C00046G0001 [uncultured bacterium]